MTLRPLWKTFLSGVECGYLLSGDGGHHGLAFFSMDTKVTGIGVRAAVLRLSGVGSGSPLGLVLSSIAISMKD